MTPCEMCNNRRSCIACLMELLNKATRFKVGGCVVASTKPGGPWSVTTDLRTDRYQHGIANLEDALKLAEEFSRRAS